MARGRALYLAEGCGYCHSQLVRPIFVDAAYGRPSEVTDYADAAPPLVGTERTGPDLSQCRHPPAERDVEPAASLQSAQHGAGLGDAGLSLVFRDRRPRAGADGANAYVLVLAEPFLPPGKVALPRREALDLVAYLQTLKQE